MPPFFYKEITDDGLYRYISVLIERVADNRLKLLLYHIPQISGVRISNALIRKLYKAYPETILGVKDSEGSPEHTFELLEEMPEVKVFVGTEHYLAQALAAGGAGCISAMTNLNAAGLRQLYDDWHKTGAREIQERVTQVRRAVESFPMIPALKAAVALLNSDPAWATPRPPLSPLGSVARQELMTALMAAGYMG